MAASLLWGVLILCPGAADAKLMAATHAAGAASSEGRLRLSDEGLLQAPLLLNSVRAAKKATSATPSSDGSGDVQSITRPMDFDRRLIVCNAYPSMAPAELKWNDVVPSAETTIPFNRCQYVEGNLRQYDRLQFALRADLALASPSRGLVSTGKKANGTTSPAAAEVAFADEAIQAATGTFEVGELPTSDATMLLVFGKRDDYSSQAKFKSLVFPSLDEGDDAQVALLDALPANDTGSTRSSFRLKLEDHASPHEAPKRVERLSFNRLFSMEAGRYDVSVSPDYAGGAASPTTQRQQGATAAHRVVSFKAGQHYILLRTGGIAGFPQSLVVFPDDDESTAEQAHDKGEKRFYVILVFSVVGVVAVGVLGLLAVRNWRLQAAEELAEETAA